MVLKFTGKKRQNDDDWQKVMEHPDFSTNIHKIEQKISLLESDLNVLCAKRDKFAAIQLDHDEKYRTMNRIEIQIDSMVEDLEYNKALFQRIADKY